MRRLLIALFTLALVFGVAGTVSAVKVTHTFSGIVDYIYDPLDYLSGIGIDDSSMVTGILSYDTSTTSYYTGISYGRPLEAYFILTGTFSITINDTYTAESCSFYLMVADGVPGYLIDSITASTDSNEGLILSPSSFSLGAFDELEFYGEDDTGTAWSGTIIPLDLTNLTNASVTLSSWSEVYRYDIVCNIQSISSLVRVPEPSTMLLLGSGLLGLWGLRRKFRK